MSKLDDNSFGAIVSFAGMFLLMGFDYSIGGFNRSNPNIAFLIPLLFLLILGSYCSIQWMIEKKKIEH